MATAPIKSRARALEKIVNDYGGVASRIKDLARNTIIVPADQIDSVASALANNGAAVKRIDAATDPLGYSGVNSSLKTKNGITGEIQVNSPEMIYAKETPKNARAILGDDVYDSISAKTGIEGGLGHKLYEQWRALPEGNQGRLPIEAQSKAYYDAIRSKTGQSATNGQLTKQEALQRMQEALRYRQLSWNHEQKKFSIIEAHGISRAEQALRRRFEPSNIEGVDFLDPTGLGKISLKGPFLDKNLQPLKLGYQQKAAENILKHVEANKAVDVHIIDTKGLNDDVFRAMQETLKNSQTKIQYLR